MRHPAVPPPAGCLQIDYSPIFILPAPINVIISFFLIIDIPNIFIFHLPTNFKDILCFPLLENRRKSSFVTPFDSITRD
jgi:hypothetical protein